MYSVHEKKCFGKKSENGFVLIAALMGIMILLAVGYFALTVSTGDLRIASRLVGERKAFSAAESGVHAILSSSIALTTTGITETQVDATNDPTATYSATTQASGEQIKLAGYDPSSMSSVFETTVTGKDSRYDAEVRLSVGIIGQPVDATTRQGGN